MALNANHIFVIKLRPSPEVDSIHALRAVLKFLLRRFGLHCISIEEEHKI